MKLKELWRALPGFEKRYEVSDAGRIRALYSSYRNIHKIGRILKPWRSNRHGHLRVTLIAADGTHIKRYIHDLILTAFVGPCPKGLEGLHGDNKPSNNTLSNLRWGTHKENMADQLRHGTRARGIKHGHAKLNEADVLAIRQLLTEGKTQQEIADQFSVSRSRISYIKDRKNWGHL